MDRSCFLIFPVVLPFFFFVVVVLLHTPEQCDLLNSSHADGLLVGNCSGQPYPVEMNASHRCEPHVQFKLLKELCQNKEKAEVNLKNVFYLS